MFSFVVYRFNFQTSIPKPRDIWCIDAEDLGENK